MRNLITYIFLLATVAQAFAQKEPVDISMHTSCETALDLSGKTFFGPTTAPAASKELVFGRTEYVVWYYFKAVKTGKLTFEIVPQDTLDNYDFMVFKEDGRNFCSNAGNKIQPVRFNYARTEIGTQGKTGLTALGNNSTYSKALDVKEGEVYYIKVSNLYEERSGHSITFKFLETNLVKGVVLDKETQKELKDIEVTCINTRTNEIIGRAETDKKGEYTLELGFTIEANTFPKFQILAYSDNHFLADTLIPAKDIKSGIPPLQLSLEKLKKDAKYPLNIYFSANSPNSMVEPGSYATLDKVYQLMSKNESISILAEGHSNGFYPSTDVDDQLSEDRAKAVKNYLVSRGISADRIEIVGRGCQRMMYQFPLDEIEESFNRRVEIYITKFK